jgi:hypothetical protein
MKVYLSGPMTGIPEFNHPAFHTAAAELRAKGLEVINPAELNPDLSQPWETCIRTDIKALCDCDAIALMPGWETSRGAHLELHIAHRIGMGILYVSDLGG